MLNPHNAGLIVFSVELTYLGSLLQPSRCWDAWLWGQYGSQECLCRRNKGGETLLLQITGVQKDGVVHCKRVKAGKWIHSRWKVHCFDVHLKLRFIAQV